MALTPKQELFVEEYFICGLNATKAALAAGYSPKTAYSQGQRLLKNVEIANEVRRHLEESAMNADEVMARLAGHARSDMSDYVIFDEGGNPEFDLRAAMQAGKLGLTKKLKVKTRRWNEPYYDATTDDIEQRQVTETALEFELYDAQAALVHIGKHHKLFTDTLDVRVQDVSQLSDDELKAIVDAKSGGRT